mgnify:CR=1 FL=1
MRIRPGVILIDNKILNIDWLTFTPLPVSHHLSFLFFNTLALFLSRLFDLILCLFYRFLLFLLLDRFELLLLLRRLLFSWKHLYVDLRDLVLLA